MPYSADVNAHAAAFDAAHALAAAIQAGIDDIDPLDAVAATLTTDLEGANNDLVFTADEAGAEGNSLAVSYVDPGEETAEESVAVFSGLSGVHIQVTLRSVSTTLSTAAQVASAVNGDAVAGELVTVANAPANNGTGEVVALGQTYFSGGKDEVSGVQQLAEKAHMRVPDVVAATQANAISLPQVFQVASAFDGSAYKEFYDSITGWLESKGPAGFLL